MPGAVSPLSKSSGPLALDQQTTLSGTVQGNIDPVVINVGATDPTAGAGVAAPVGSLALGTGGQMWLKTGAAATAWGEQAAGVLSTTTLIPGGNGAGNVGDLATTPVQVVAAPAAGSIIQVISCFWSLNFDTAAYDGAATMQLRYTNGAGAAILGTAVPAADLITSAADALVSSLPADNVIMDAAVAAPVVADASVDPFAAAGDSPLTVQVFYRIIDDAL